MNENQERFGRQQNIDLINDHHQWGGSLILPVVRREGRKSISGVILKRESSRVYLINIWEIADPTSMEAFPSVKFGSVEAMVDDGWEVD